MSTQYAASSRSPSRTSGLTLRAKPGAAGSTGCWRPRYAVVPAQHVAEQHRGFVVEVVTGREHVVAVVDRGLVEDVALRQPARRARHALRRARAVGDVEAVRRRGRSTSSSVPAVSLREVARVTARRVGVVADAEARRRGRRPRSRARAAGATARASPCRPTRRRAPASPGWIMSNSSIARRTCSRQWCRKQSRQKRRVVAPDVDDRRRSRHRRHFTAAPPETTGRISTTSSSREALVAGHQGVVADDEHRLRDHVEVRRSCSTVRGAGSSSSRRGLRSTTFIGGSSVPAGDVGPTYSGLRAPNTKMSPGATLVRNNTSGSLRDAPDRSGTDREDREDHEHALTRSGPGGCRSTSPGGARR